MIKVTYSPQTNLNFDSKIKQLRRALEQYSCNCSNACAIELVSEAARAQFRVSCGRIARAALGEEKK